MHEQEFDRFADEYQRLMAETTGFAGDSPDYFLRYKIDDAVTLLRELDLAEAPRILDFGAGIGSSVPLFRERLPHARIVCLDVSGHSLAVGRGRFHDQAEFVQFDGGRLPFADNSFDLAFAAGVFHHIPHPHHPGLLRELARCLNPRGRLLVFEHNPYNPLTRYVVDRCPLDENAQLIAASQLRRRALQAGLSAARIDYRLFFPGRLSALRFLEPGLTWLPLGAQYRLTCRT